MNFKLRDYQQRDINLLRQRFREGDTSVLYNLPTGGGKTVVAAFIIDGAAKRGNTVWFLMHRSELISQSIRTLQEIGINPGVIAAGFTPDFTAPVQVVGVQTIARRLGKYLPPTLMIPDEAHHFTKTNQCGKVLQYYIEKNNARVLGLTATPGRLDGQGLGVDAGGFFQSLVRGPSLSELIAQKYLSPPCVYTPPIGADLDNLHKRYGDFVQAEVSAAMDKPVVTGNAVDHYKKICAGVPAIVFCASVKHAENVAAEFSAAGYQAASIDGQMHDVERRRRVRDLGNGGLHILTSCEVLGEGVDCPVVGAAILLRPTASLTLLLQQVGRALRVSPGKEKAIILDHVSNLKRHNLLGIGFPEWDIQWDLSGEIKRKKATESNIALRQCPQCYRCFRPAPACPFCGHVSESNAREIDQVDGELTQIDPATLARLREAESNRAKMFRQREEGMCRTLEDFQALAKVRGYNPAWARIRWDIKRRRTRPEPPMLPGM